MSASSRRADLAARAAAVAGTSTGTSTGGAGAAAGTDSSSATAGAGAGAESGSDSGSRVPRTRPVRVTVELSPMEHKALRQWCAQTSADLDLPVVAGAEVFRALLSLMRNDPEVAEQVRAELERTGGSRRRH
ncbi:MAG TPA: hypothetical protein VGD73_30045 [Pseudonocardia sp.]|uniref:hypothetical protein n=1 Tax=Pseudonocardia sp. TaxID=60912 RepID=UPI002ED9C7BA